jgi:hypothetical protein
MNQKPITVNDALEELKKISGGAPKNEQQAMLLDVIRAIHQIASPDPVQPFRNGAALMKLHKLISQSFPEAIPAESLSKIMDGTHSIYNWPVRRPRTERLTETGNHKDFSREFKAP